MNELQRIEERISSIRELKGLFRAMRVMAASHVQQAQSGLAGARRYAEIVEAALSEALLLVPNAAASSNGQEPDSVPQIVVVCSEHGFVGALNDKLLETVSAEAPACQRLLVVGRRGVVLADERRLTADWTSSMPTQLGAIPRLAGDIIANLEFDKPVQIVFAHYRLGGKYTVESRSLLPIDISLISSSTGSPSPPLHHLPPQILLHRLIEEYLFAAIARAMIESLASENAARLQIMQQADRNIDAKLDLLTRDRRAQRQDAITSELLDVVTGTEAMRVQ